MIDDPEAIDWLTLLPSDMWAEALMRVGFKDRSRASLVCKEFRRILATYNGVWGDKLTVSVDHDGLLLQETGTRGIAASNLCHVKPRAFDAFFSARIQRRMWNAIEITSFIEMIEERTDEVDANLTALITAIAQAEPVPATTVYLSVRVVGYRNVPHPPRLATLVHSLLPSAKITLSMPLALNDYVPRDEEDEEEETEQIREAIDLNIRAVQDVPQGVELHLDVKDFRPEFLSTLHRATALKMIDQGPFYPFSSQRVKCSTPRLLRLKVTNVSAEFLQEGQSFRYVLDRGLLAKLEELELESDVDDPATIWRGIPSLLRNLRCLRTLRLNLVSGLSGSSIRLRRLQDGAPLTPIDDTMEHGAGPIEPSPELRTFLLRSLPSTIKEVNYVDREHSLAWAVEQGDATLVKSLLSRGANPDVGVPSYVIHRAAEMGRANLITLLSEAGTDVNLAGPNLRGSTPLHVAAKHGHVEAVTELIRLGADKSKRLRLRSTPTFPLYKGGFTVGPTPLELVRDGSEYKGPEENRAALISLLAVE